MTTRVPLALRRIGRPRPMARAWEPTPWRAVQRAAWAAVDR
jgi:hypothetical protein